MLFTQGQPMAESVLPHLAFPVGFFVAIRQNQNVLQIQGFVIGTPAPGNIQLHGVETERFQFFQMGVIPLQRGAGGGPMMPMQYFMVIHSFRRNMNFQTHYSRCCGKWKCVLQFF